MAVIEIALQGKAGGTAYVDDVDADLVEPYRWTLLAIRTCRYARATIGGQSIYLHRLIMAAPSGVEVDHVDHDGLNNWRSNLRLATRSQNRANQRPHRDGSSQYKGVTWDRERRLWAAQSHTGGRHTHLGRYATEEEAARAHDAFSAARWGEFAYLNFPTPKED